MLEVADAALLIGDAALLALEEEANRRERTGEELVDLDLAEVWREQTGSGWCFCHLGRCAKPAGYR